MCLMVRNILYDVKVCLSTLCPPATYPSSWSVLPPTYNFRFCENLIAIYSSSMIRGKNYCVEILSKFSTSYMEVFISY